MYPIIICTAVCLGLYFIKNYFNGGVCHCKGRLDGKTVIITGANAGIGKQTALILAKKGAKVILACRNLEKGEEAVREIKAKTGNKKVAVLKLDLASFASVRQFCAEFLERHGSRLDVLINNAAVYYVPFSLTEDGHETLWQSNYLGHFLLTLLLLDKLKENKCGRIINVSSIAYQIGTINFGDLNGEIEYDKSGAYGQSKLAMILFTRYLSIKLKDAVTVNSLHPGVVRTQIFNKHYWLSSSLGRIVNYPLMMLLFKSSEQGAQTTVHCAVSDECGTNTGLYFKDCKVANLLGIAEDDEVAKKLWNLSLDLVGLDADRRFEQ